MTTTKEFKQYMHLLALILLFGGSLWSAYYHNLPAMMFALWAAFYNILSFPSDSKE